MGEHEFDRHASTYSEKINARLTAFGQEHDFFIRAKAEMLVAGLASIKGRRLLDVGCGIGLIHPHLLAHAAEIHGVDVSAASLEVARQRNRTARYEAYDGRVLPYGDGSFDCAFAICVLHHVRPVQWPDLVTEMRRVVRPGGLVFIAEHNPLNPATQWVVRTCDLDDGAVLLPHWRLRKLLDGAGLEQLNVRHAFFTPFDRPIFRRLDAALSWLPLGAQYIISGRVPTGRDRGV